MKKIILSVSMMLFAFMTQAAEKTNLKNQFLSQSNKIQSFMMVPCTVTAKGTVDLGPVAVEVSCSVTASTCPEASIQAATCLKASLATVSSVIL